MKFGKYLLRNQARDWSRHYVAYKHLKQLIKASAHSLKLKAVSIDDVIASFVFELDRELEKACTFYTHQRTEIERQWLAVSEKHRRLYGASNFGLLAVDSAVTNDSLARVYHSEPIAETALAFEVVLKELRDSIRDTIRFADMNLSALEKILKKFDKKLGLDIKQSYLSSKVCISSIASNSPLAALRQDVFALLVNVRQQKDRAEAIINSAPESCEDVSLPFTRTEFDRLILAIEEDDAEALRSGYLARIRPFLEGSDELAQALTALLRRALTRRSLSCCKWLVQHNAGSTPSLTDVNDQTLLHKMAMRGGVVSLENSCPSSSKVRQPQIVAADLASPEDSELIELFLANLSGDVDPHIPDLHGRRPLHYAAMNNFSKLCNVLLHDLMSRPASAHLRHLFSPLWCDKNGYTPLMHAASRGMLDVVRAFVAFGPLLNVDQVVEHALIGNTPQIPGSDQLRRTTLLHLACRSGYAHVVAYLLIHGADPNLICENNDTALTVAIRYRHANCIRELLSTADSDDMGTIEGVPQRVAVDTNMADKRDGITPLIFSVNETFLDAVHELLIAGADTTAIDANGWTAFEYAVYNGSQEIIDLLKKHVHPMKEIDIIPDRHLPSASPSSGSSGFSPATTEGAAIRRTSTTEPPQRAYGHRFLEGHICVQILLGGTDSRVNDTPITLTDDEQATSLRIYLQSMPTEAYVVQLPYRDFSEDIRFTVNDSEAEVVICFDLAFTYEARIRGGSVLARGLAILPLAKPTVKSSSITVVPLLAATSLSLMGQLCFESVVVRPFYHANMNIGARSTYWRSYSTKVIGHRGLGANRSGLEGSRLQLSENTVLSFVTAASLGAEYVEFDVQLTRDFTPVIYHDWNVSETGLDISVADLSLEQFLALRPCNVKSASSKISRGLDRATSKTTIRKVYQEAKEREASAHKVFENTLPKSKDYGMIKSPFTTLTETLQRVPVHVGFNVEVKFPQIEEIEAHQLRPLDLNKSIDSILDCVYTHAGERNIVFSSFHPEACMMLALKQPNYPVLFLTDGGTIATVDIRCASLRASVEFAKRIDLLGIVTECQPILDAPGLVKGIKAQGLLVLTYGRGNNLVKNVHIQRAAGVDAVIVDSVLAVRKGLQSA